jgi:8-amino-7-oxononanoate synthase
VVVNLETESLSSPGRVGEIWVSGPSVALGYWNRPEETARTFRAYLKESGAGPFLRTGDLGFLQAGELFVTGRLKDLIIIRGRNYYPQDIELTVEQSHPALRRGCGAAFSVEAQGEERLVVVQEVERQYLHKLDVDEVIGAIRRAVGEFHELNIHAVVLLKTGSIPKTSSGKIQRRLCRERFLNDGLVAVSARSQFAIKAGMTHGTSATPPCEQRAAASHPSPAAIQAWLVSQLAEQLKVAPQEINVRESFIHHGLDSVAAVGIFSKLEDWLGRRLPPNLFWDYPNIESLTGYLVGESNGLNATDEVPREYYRFELFPEYRELQQLRNAIEGQGISIPYFKPHGRVAADTTFIDGREFINFSSYNYLGMSGDPKVSQAAKEAIDRYGTSVSASRLVSGERPLHRELETAIAELIGAEDCIVYVGGHSANVTTISHLLRPDDLILYDALSHNSVLQGCLLSGARSLPFPHNDWQALDEMLREHRRRHKRVLIVIEGVYSMDGDIPDLPQFIEIKRRHKALLMIDEAHSMGVLGERGYGVREYFGVAPDEVDLWMGTLSKSFASCGGYIAAGRAVIEYLKYTAPGFVYSVGISPPNAASALAAIQLLKAEPERVARLHERARLFLALTHEHGLNNGASKDSPVVPVIVGDSLQCILLSRELLDRGINVQPIIYPAVEERASRLRFFISSTHTEEQIRFTVSAVADAFALAPDKLAAVDRINSA